MKSKLLCCLALVGLSLVPQSRAQLEDGTYIESDGLVIMELESTLSDLGLWEKRTEIDGFTGYCYLEFMGNTPINGDPKSPLEFTFLINKPGLYYLNLYCAKEIVNGRDDVANDCYVRVDGDYGAGPDTARDCPLENLKSNTKFYGGSAMQMAWSYGSRLDLGDFKRNAIYDFKAGEVYTLVVHGRSQLFKMDRIVFRHIDTPLATSQNLSLTESERVGDFNDAPIVDAGEDLSVHYPEFAGILRGDVLDDGRPVDLTMTYTWEQMSGPAEAVIASNNALVSRVELPEVGSYVFRLTADDGELARFDEVTVVGDMRPSIGDVVYAINCGGPAYTAFDGTEYVADAHFSGGNTYADRSYTTFGDTDDDTLYINERYGPTFQYTLPVENGNYDIILQFAENYWTATGKRNIAVAIEGTTVISGLDVYAVAGRGNAYDLKFTVTVADGELNINFSNNNIDSATVNAIRVTEVLSPTVADTLYTQWAADMNLSGMDADPTRDLDGDGFTNMEEFLSGFNPTNASSHFAVKSFQQASDDGQQIVLEWESVTGRVYNVTQSSSLTLDDFVVVQADITYPQNTATVDVSQADSVYLRVDVQVP